MARYAYDVNTTQRLIDVHKQFQGGLKTVDTDDSLGAVFLRDAENVSLSEFGFIEKRYGTYLNSEQAMPTAATTLQGYWEFQGYKIYAIDGKFYVNNETDHRGIEKEKADEWRYPTLPAYPFSETNFRDMNAVNINSVLYIFTGFYPVYAKVVNVAAEGEAEDLQLKFYWFSIDIPTYDEIVVVGHNLLENDYETVYSEKNLNFTGGSSYNPGVTSVTIQDSNYLPKFPFVYDTETEEKGSLTFDFKTVFPTNNDFVTWGPGSNQPYIQIVLDSAQYKSSGPGSSSLDFIPLDKSEIDFDVIDNYGGQESSFEVFNDAILDRAYFESGETNYKRDLDAVAETQIGTYFFTKRIAVSKEIMQNAITFDFTLFKKLENSFEIFNLSQYQHTFQDYTTRNEFLEAKIIPIDTEGKEKETVYFPALLHVSGNYTFSRPSINFFNTSGFIVEISHRVHEIVYSAQNELQGPTDFEDTSKYAVSFASTVQLDVGTKKLTSSTIPGLGLTLKNLLVGTFDFEFSFKINAYYYNTLTEQLKLGFSDSFFTQVNNITIVSEKLQDYPGVTEEFLPKLKALWSCNKVLEHFGKLMVWGSKEMPTAVFYSFPDRPTFFPSKFYLDFTNDDNSPVQAVTPYMNILVAQTEEQTWGVRGNSGLIDAPSPYIPFMINPTVGTIAYKSVRPVRNHLFFLSKQGIIALKSLYAADEQYNIDFMDRNIFNIVPRDTKAVGIQYDNQYWLNFPERRITLRWYIDKKAWVLDTYRAWYDFKGVFKYQIKDGKLEFITIPSKFEEDSQPSVYKIGIDESLPSDLNKTIPSKFETSFLNQNYPFHIKNYKEFKYDFTMQNEYNFSRDPIYLETRTIQGTSLLIQNITLKKNHYYRLSFAAPIPVSDIRIGTTPVTFVGIEGSSILEGFTDFEFLVSNDLGGLQDITIYFEESVSYLNPVAIKDITYDNTMTFLSKIISEERNILNQQLPIGYDEEQEAINIDLADFENFTLGSSYFGDRVTFVRTIKLSGKGYNTKAYFEDFSKAKWTIESMGITYKMKKARSR